MLFGFLRCELSINWTGSARGEKFFPLDVVDLPPHQVDHRKVDLLYLTACHSSTGYLLPICGYLQENICHNNIHKKFIDESVHK